MRETLLLLVAGSAGVGFLVLRTGLRYARRASRRIVHHLERRAVDAVLAVVLFRWLRRPERSVPRPPVLEGDDIYRACPLSLWASRSGCDPACCRWCGDPLPTGKPRWCTARCRRIAESNHVWPKARDAALARDGDACTRPGCAVEKELQVHHVTAVLGAHDVDGCHHHLAGLVTLCPPHHQHETNEQRRRGVFR